MARLEEHLDGRRLLDRPDPGLEPEPATLAQLPARSRIAAAAARLVDADGLLPPDIAALVDGTLGELVRTLASSQSLHVAEWTAASDVLDALAARLEASAGVDKGPD
ncbi:hypothetical protein TBR22_A08100 [Luteitalea sp. TBR-22]|nr:hypothetical protein TBR22_A08100 [Luteitalea sp. TBR-22]